MRICVAGAGPIGLEFSTSAVARGHSVVCIERGACVAANVNAWKHVRLFSPWELNISPDGKAALAGLSLTLPPAKEFPTGAQLVTGYLQPLANRLIEQSTQFQLLLNTVVVSVGKSQLLKRECIGGGARKGGKFRILVQDVNMGEDRFLEPFDAVVDCTGTYGNGNWLGPGGLPAVGERSFSAAAALGGLAEDDRLIRTVPDPLNRDRGRFLGKTTAVVGSGYSAATTIAALRALALEEPAVGVRVKWITRRQDVPYARVEGDPLPQRDALAALGNEIMAGKAGGTAAGNDTADDAGGGGNATAGDAAAAGTSAQAFYAECHSGVTVQELRRAGGPGGLVELVLRREDNGSEQTVAADVVVANVGYRPDASLYEELQVHQCYASEGPMKLAAALLASSGTASGNCLDQVTPGAETLLTSEPNFFIVGMKSYGRGSQFLLRVGHEQVAHVLELLGRVEQQQ
ncbi:unnamed protein product [Phaeothamnion confervicola]